ncbi:MAG TPA: hypothetical protein VHS97_02830 [Isosphaeraceae bacterium]|nr:hypothetical protein [Isosphaeraceae bacterium]
MATQLLTVHEWTTSAVTGQRRVHAGLTSIDSSLEHHSYVEFNPRAMRKYRGVRGRQGSLSGKRAWFNFSIFAGEKSWVAGVELATVSEPPARLPRIWGRRPSGVDPSHPLRCNQLLNLAGKR